MPGGYLHAQIHTVKSHGPCWESSVCKQDLAVDQRFLKHICSFISCVAPELFCKAKWATTLCFSLGFWPQSFVFLSTPIFFSYYFHLKWDLSFSMWLSNMFQTKPGWWVLDVFYFFCCWSWEDIRFCMMKVTCHPLTQPLTFEMQN